MDMLSPLLKGFSLLYLLADQRENRCGSPLYIAQIKASWWRRLALRHAALGDEIETVPETAPRLGSLGNEEAP
jgi:hypothetical protein